MKNILVTGSNGQLGSELKELSKGLSDFQFLFTDVHTLDIANEEQLKQCISQNSIDIIINAAAYTAVDKAETDSITARLVNTTAVEHIAKVCQEKNIRLIHVSTDYVFDGTAHTPYTEDMPTSPIGIYGHSKLDGELAVQRHLNNGIIIRTSWLYSSFGHNFAKTILKLSKEKEELNVIFDQVGTPTYARDLADAIIHIITKIDQVELTQTEIFHYSNEGVASWYDFAKAITEFGNTTCKINPIETHEYPTHAKRPAYSVLNKVKIKKTFTISIPYWRDSLKQAIEIINQS